MDITEEGDARDVGSINLSGFEPGIDVSLLENFRANERRKAELQLEISKLNLEQQQQLPHIREFVSKQRWGRWDMSDGGYLKLTRHRRRRPLDMQRRQSCIHDFCTEHGLFAEEDRAKFSAALGRALEAARSEYIHESVKYKVSKKRKRD